PYLVAVSSNAFSMLLSPLLSHPALSSCLLRTLYALRPALGWWRLRSSPARPPAMSIGLQQHSSCTSPAHRNLRYSRALDSILVLVCFTTVCGRKGRTH